MGWRIRIAAPMALMLCVIGLTGGSVEAKDKTSEPNSHAYGKSLAEWTKRYFEWERPGGSGEDTVGRVRFMPIPQGEYRGGDFTPGSPGLLEGTLDVTLKPGTPFVLPVAMWIGESYDPVLGVGDDPELDASVFTGSNVLVTMDGTPIIDSSVDDLSDWYVAPQYFDPPIVYPTTSPSGSIAANFVQGISFVHGPLSKGDHTLDLRSEIIIPDFNLGVQYHNTWTIHVRE